MHSKENVLFVGFHKSSQKNFCNFFGYLSQNHDIFNENIVDISIDRKPSINWFFSSINVIKG